eukprot:gene21732-28125_t
MEENNGTFSHLQHLLQLAYSDEPEDQQNAAVNLSRLIEGTVFPAVSFGPLAHALCRLLPSQNRTVCSYAARALKLLLLDDALRPQAVVAGVPAVVCATLKQWEDEILCLRELLGALQTLCWDKQCVRSVLQADIISQLNDYINSNDQEVSILALATLSNILVVSDSLLLSDTVSIEALGAGMVHLLDTVQQTQQRPQRFYAAAALANASAHPRLASIINQNGGLQIFRDLERQSLASLHVLGSRLCECSQTAVYRLSDKREGDSKMALQKYSFKWGTQPTMELTLAKYGDNSKVLYICFGVWLLIVVFTFSPVIFN